MLGTFILFSILLVAELHGEGDTKKLVSFKRVYPSEEEWIRCSEKYPDTIFYHHTGPELSFHVKCYCGRMKGINGQTQLNEHKRTLIVDVGNGRWFQATYMLEQANDFPYSTTDDDEKREEKTKVLEDSIVLGPTYYLDTGKRWMVKYYNKGTWWCHALPSSTFFKRDIDKCYVFEEEYLMKKDKDYYGAGPAVVPNTYTDCSNKNEPHQVCKKKGVIFMAHYLCSNDKVGYILHAIYDSTTLQKYQVSNSFTINKYKPSDINKVCDLFNTYVERKGKTYTVKIQYFKDGHWICNTFKKYVTESKAYQLTGMNSKEAKCNRFRDYQIP